MVNHITLTNKANSGGKVLRMDLQIVLKFDALINFLAYLYQSAKSHINHVQKRLVLFHKSILNVSIQSNTPGLLPNGFQVRRGQCNRCTLNCHTKLINDLLLFGKSIITIFLDNTGDQIRF